MALALREIPKLDDDDAIAELSRRSPGWRLEFDADGTLLANLTDGNGAACDVEVEVSLQLRRYADIVGGKVFGSSTGFRLPDGSLRSPDAAWISATRLASLTSKERIKFWRVCPDVVVEIMSASDAWRDVLIKLDAFLRNGALCAIGIDPFERRYVARGTSPDGLSLDYEALFDA